MVDKERLIALRDKQLSLIAKLSLSRDHGLNQDEEARGEQSDTQARLEAELAAKGVVPHAFVRVPQDYYERDLEWRRACLSAESVLHLCKSIVMENTKIDENVPGCPKYCCVIVQYAARLHAEKLKRLMHKQHKEGGGVLGIKSFNMRLAPEEVSTRLTGFKHNAVTPICSAAPDMPIVLSHRIANLAATDAFMWLGAGETDLKVGFNVQNFIRAYMPMVVDCTYDT